jgi:hypothetical protein
MNAILFKKGARASPNLGRKTTMGQSEAVCDRSGTNGTAADLDSTAAGLDSTEVAKLDSEVAKIDISRIARLHDDDPRAAPAQHVLHERRLARAARAIHDQVGAGLGAWLLEVRLERRLKLEQRHVAIYLILLAVSMAARPMSDSRQAFRAAASATLVEISFARRIS